MQSDRRTSSEVREDAVLVDDVEACFYCGALIEPWRVILRGGYWRPCCQDCRLKLLRA